MRNIFIVHSPFQVFIAEAIVSTSFTQPNCDNVLLLELSRNKTEVNRALWSAVDYLEVVGASTVGRTRYLMSERNMAVLREQAGRDKDTRLFLSDIAWPMNNRAFFDRRMRNSVRFSLLSDGIGTYALPSVTRALFVRGLAKSVNGCLHGGVRYRSYLGSQFGVDRYEIESVHAPNAELIRCEPAKRREVSLPGTAPRAPFFDRSKGLFLDQPYWRHMQEGEWTATRSESVALMKSLGLGEWHYKNHHAGRSEEVAYYESLGFKVIHSDKCAEQVVAESDFGTVVSYGSSALFNLKCIHGDRLRCIAMFTEAVSAANGFNDDTSATLTSLFRAVGVEIVEIAEGRG
jgi:hypothetical protein